MTDKLFALVGLALFAIFCGILIAFVPHPDLVAVVIIVLLMTAWDFIRELFFAKRKNGK